MQSTGFHAVQLSPDHIFTNCISQVRFVIYEYVPTVSLSIGFQTEMYAQFFIHSC
jgi:hypothetical protein